MAEGLRCGRTRIWFDSTATGRLVARVLQEPGGLHALRPRTVSRWRSWSEDPLPGELFPADDQCKLALGKRYSAYASSKSPFNDVCRELWCQQGQWASAAHPALDGTTCATGKYCREGSCVVAAQDGGSGAVAPPKTATRSGAATTPAPRRPNSGRFFPSYTNIWDRWFNRVVSRLF
ncbi:hypothetical protein MRX96_042787 [Rhipicephalus microplus]